jgi:hypothetical protein
MFRFTIRELLLLTVVVGMGVGWYLHYQRLTRPPKLYRDDEIETLMRYNARYAVDPGVDPPRLLVVPEGTTMPLSQVLMKMGIDPNRLTDLRTEQYNRSISLSWQISPRYDLYCLTDDEDDALAFDDPKREISFVQIHDRLKQLPPPPSDKEEQGNVVTGGIEL